MKRFCGIAFSIWYLIFTLSFAGCSSTTNKPSVSSGKNTGIQTEKSIKGEITYWSSDNPDFIEANEELIARFQKQYPDVTVKYEHFQYDTFIGKLKSSYASRTESDVQQIFGSWTRMFAKKGFLDQLPKDLTNYEKSDYYEPAYGGYMYKGELYGVPREFNIENGGVLYYPDEMKKLGLNGFPETYDAFMNAAKKLTQYDDKGNITRAGFDFNSVDNTTFLFLSLILQQGGSYWNKDGKHVDFTSPQAEKAMQEMVDYIKKYKVTSLEHCAFNTTFDIENLFFEDKSAMCFRGPWTMAAGVNDYGLENFAYGSMPSFTGSSKAFAAESGWGEVVSSRSQNKEAAWEFVRFITSEENSRYFNEKTFTVPALKKVAESEAFQKNRPRVKVSIDILKDGRPIGDIPDIDQFKNTVMLNYLKIIESKQNVKEALVSIQNETNKMIDEE